MSQKHKSCSEPFCVLHINVAIILKKVSLGGFLGNLVLSGFTRDAVMFSLYLCCSF